MTTCVLINDKGEFVNLIVAEPTDFVEEGWRLEVVPEGYFWNGKAIVLSGTMQNEVIPEII
jgi:hypothetical protein